MASQIFLHVTPFLVEFFPSLNIVAKEAANEGFSATIKTVRIILTTFWFT